jgi:hypothetical protein
MKFLNNELAEKTRVFAKLRNVTCRVSCVTLKILTLRLVEAGDEDRTIIIRRNPRHNIFRLLNNPTTKYMLCI